MKIYAHFGFKDFILALGYKGEYIKNYFINYYLYNNDFTVHLGNKEKIEIHGNHQEEDWKVTLVDTGLNSMTGYRVKLCGKYINEERFMFTYRHAVADIDISKLVDSHIKSNTIGTVTGIYPPSRFDNLVTDEDRIIKFKHIKGN